MTARRSWANRNTAQARRALAAALVSSALSAPAAAATFGVPTNLSLITHEPTATSANPNGWFLLAGTDGPAVNGETVHQLRLFIEVTGTTLDVRVFDPGNSGARDDTGDGDLRTTFLLLNPCATFPTCTGTTRSQVLNLNNDNVATQGRLARFTPANNGFLALNSGSANNVPFTGLTPGLYEFRVTSTEDSDEANFFGVDIRDAAGNSLNAFTIGRTAGPATSMLVGTNNSGSTPQANITQPLGFFPYVNSGCTMQTSNFDMDVAGTPGAGSNGSIQDVSSVTTALTMSGEATHTENTITVEPGTGVNTESTNYGMYVLANNTGSQQNWFDWRIADFGGWTNNPANLPRNPSNPIRMYLPNRSAIDVGAAGVTAPLEPVLRTSLQYLSGPNPPSTTGTTRFAIYGHLDNLTGLPIDNALISVGIPGPATAVLGTLTAYIEGLSTACSSSTLTTSLAQCTFATLAANQTATIRFEVRLAPPAAGTYLLTGAPAAGSPPPNTTARGAYASAFATTENLGPVCDLRVDTTTVLTRATLRGVRVDPRGLVEFATATQKGTQAFNVYGTNDPHGAGARVRLNDDPILAALPDSMTPIVYRAPTLPITTPYILIEEVERGGRSNMLGPFPVGDARLRALFESLEQKLDQAGARPVASGRNESRRLPVGIARAQRGEVTGPPRRVRRPLRFTPGIKIEAAEAGTVRLPLAELHANGLPATVPSAHLQLTSQGAPVPFRIERGAPGMALVFEAERLSTAYTGTNVYVLSWKTKLPQLVAGLTRWEYAAQPGFRRVETNSFFVPSAPQGDDPWLWDLLFGDGTPWPYDFDPALGDFDLPGLPGALSGPVPVRIRFAGSSAHQHTVEARINGEPVGSVSFVGSQPGILTGEVPGEALLPAGNRLELVYTTPSPTPANPGYVYLNYLELGLPAPPPAEIAPQVSRFDPNLTKRVRNADYLVLTHSLFEAQAQQIADAKASAGYSAAVLNVERAYDRFSTGIVEANALRELLRELAAGGRLRYVLLLGDDSFDPQDFMGLGLASYVPSLYAWDDQFGRVPSENAFADTDGDGRPDLAIGRLPAQSEQQAAVLADKVSRQAQSLRQAQGRHLFGVDNDRRPISFRALADAVAAGLPPGSQVTFADAGVNLVAARATLLDGLRQGSLVTHIFSHGGPELWADEALASVEDIEGLDGSPGEGVVLQWACQSQWYQYPLGSTMGEALVLVPQGGALASFGPAGITDIDLQVPFYQQLYTRLFQPGLTLGEAIRDAKAGALAADPRTRPAVEGWNLLGDPALRLDGGN